MNWKPIETAPKGKSVLLYAGECCPLYCGKQRFGNLGEPQQDVHAWRCDSSGRFATPTHWMPLPPAPVAEPQGVAVDADGERYRYLRDTPMSEWPSTLPNTIIYQQSARWDAAIDNAIRATALATEFLQGSKS